MNKKIYLIRHGQKLSHPGDPGLTDLGILQAQQTGKYLSQFPISKIIASPYKRTQQTALHIGEQLGLDFTTDDALKERMNWDHESIPKEDFLSEWTKATHDRTYTPKWGDSSQTTGKRIHDLVKGFKIGKPQHIILVSHGGAIVDFLRNIFAEEEISQLITQYPEGQDYQMLNCSINAVNFEQEPAVELLNFIDHLENSSEH
jgi:2,3-bisphosphoglycerate-dependent phosphoglycerate mutase